MQLLTTALCRFMARRGRSHNIYSDNATCFKGANNTLWELRKMLNSDTFQEEINNFMKTEGVRWHLIIRHTLEAFGRLE
jgi:hypothetical protein